MDSRFAAPPNPEWLTCALLGAFEFICQFAHANSLVPASSPEETFA